MAHDETPIYNVEGELVALGPLRRDLIPTYLRWINDFDTLRTVGAVAPGPMTMEQETPWFERVATGRDVVFLLYERATRRPIGTCRLGEIDHRNGTAGFGIMIGEPECRGKGYGTEATRLVLDYAFTALGLHNVMLTVAEFNLAGRRTYEKVGFREIGRRRQDRRMGGRRWDTVYMDCLASEFTSPVLGRVFSPDEPPDEPRDRRSD